jgi:hypothetical protein
MTTQTAIRSAAAGAPYPRLLNIVTLVLALVLNGLATTGVIGGVSTGELSDAFPSLFTPAGYVFSIWGLIYSLLIAFAVYQALPAQRDNPRLERLGYLFVLSNLFNGGWIIAWQLQAIALSQLLMLGILASLILAYRQLGVGRERLGSTETVAIQLPFSVYLGWISVATVANTTVLLLTLGVDGGAAAALWTAVAIVAALGIGALVLWRRGDIAFALVLVWAFAGIAVRQSGAEPLVVGVAVAASALAAVGALASGLVRIRARRGATA